MIEIEDKLLSLDLFEKKFVCDLTACKGACCVDGDSGAPLTEEEVSIIEDELENIKPYMRKEGIEAIEDQGVFYMDFDNEPVTTLVNNQECAFVYFDENGITKCAIEKAHKEGKIDFYKPISCHLYPIRAAKLRLYTAINYNKWNICRAACQLGDRLNIKVYQFLKEPIIRKWGEEFYTKLENIDQELSKKNDD